MPMPITRNIDFHEKGPTKESIEHAVGSSRPKYVKFGSDLDLGPWLFTNNYFTHR